MKHRNRLIIYLILGIFVISGMLLVSYGYMGSDVSGNETAKEFVNLSQILKVEYSGGTENLTTKEDGYFAPGSVLTKTFSIKNTGNVNINYGVKLSDVVNDFEREEDLVYELYLEDTLLITDTFPNYDKVLAYSQTLNVGETKNYTLKVIYKESLENQIIDQNKIINAKIDFVQTKNTLSNIKLLGNTIQESKKTYDINVSNTKGYYLNSNGEEVANSGWNYTDYIEVNAYNVTLKNIGGGAPSICIYDADKTLISCKSYGTANAQTTKNVKISSAPLIKYVRFSFYNTIDLSKVSLVEGVSLSNPIDVESVGDKTINLFEYKAPQIANGTVIESLENGAIVQGKSSSTAGNFQYALGWYRPGNTTTGGNGVVLHSGDVITISADVTLLEIGSDNRSPAIAIHTYTRESNGGYTFGSSGFPTLALNKKIRVSKTYTITDKYDGQTFYPIFCLNGHKMKIENIQIAYGNIIHYEPYDKYKIPLKIENENILDMGSQTVSSGYYFDSAGGPSGADSRFVRINNIVVKPSTKYTFSNNLNIYTIWFFSPSGSISKISLSNKVNKTTFITPDNCSYIRVSLENTSGITDTKAFKWAMLQEGEGDGIYKDYNPINVFLDEPLRKLGAYEDYIDIKNKTIVRKNVKKYLADYTNWITSTEHDNNYTFAVRDDSILPRYENDELQYNYGLSNYFEVVDHWETGVYSNAIYMHNWANNVRVGMSKNDLADGSLETFKTWLNEKNPYMIRIRSEEESKDLDIPVNIYSINPDAKITFDTEIIGTLARE